MALTQSYLDTENSSDRKDLNAFDEATFQSMADLNAAGYSTGSSGFGTLTDEESIRNWFDESGLEYTPFGFMFDQSQFSSPASEVVIDENKMRGNPIKAYKGTVQNYTPLEQDRQGYNELRGLLGEVEGAYDVSGTLEAGNKANELTLLTGLQGADSVARSYRESLSPGSSGDIGAKMLRAKAMLPVMESTAQASTDLSKYADESKQNALKQSTDIASQLADLSLGYTNTLAQYNSDMHQNALGMAGVAAGQEQAIANAQLDQADLQYQTDLLNYQSQQDYQSQINDALTALNASMGSYNSGGTSSTSQLATTQSGAGKSATYQPKENKKSAYPELALYGIESSHDDYKWL
jgi:hypothetical protein